MSHSIVIKYPSTQVGENIINFLKGVGVLGELTYSVADAPSLITVLTENDRVAYSLRDRYASYLVASGPVKPLTNRDHAIAINEVAVVLMKWSKDYRKKKDKSMSDCYRDDASDLRAIASLVAKGKLKQAAYDARHLDTIVREKIPQVQWDLLMENE